ncbi:MAG: hypothetical protein NW200_12675 [Hyphomonadaceae bacterium]|nr:hypothetical protein [Hyphomonadaceae bacterium]
MKARFLLIGAAVAALGAAGAAIAADPPAPKAAIRVDADSDGFVSRVEAQAQAERLFARMDANGDGKLDEADRARRAIRKTERETRVGEDRVVEKEVVIERARDDREDRKGRGRNRGGHDGMPGGPRGMAMFMHASEADRNGDGALSREEHIAQHLRFFDAADVNGDGKIKFDPPPRPPEPPEPPEAPPAPPPPPRR